VDISTEQTAAARPVPHPTRLSRPFWDACRDRRLIVQQCRACQTYLFIPREFCSTCLSRDLTWVPALGTGRIVTHTAVWRPQTSAFSVPYVIAVIRLDEGYEMLTNVVHAEPDQITIGAKVQVCFVDVTEDVTLPCFELV
jgi:uncharacterized OB-fold protein